MLDGMRERLADIYERAYPCDMRVREGCLDEVKKAYNEADKNLTSDKHNAAWLAASAVAYQYPQDIKAAFGMGNYDGTRESYTAGWINAEKELTV